MKIKILISACMAVLLLAGCGAAVSEDSKPVSEPESSMQAAESENPAEEEAAAIPQAYEELLDLYCTALSENWNGEALVENGLNLLVKDCGEDPLTDIGFSVTDLDGDGRDELVIGTVGMEDSFCGRLILEMYTLQEDSARPVFVSGERDRYYYAGDCLFANIGSSGAADTAETTFRYADGKMEDLGCVTGTDGYVQMELTPFGSWRS